MYVEKKSSRLPLLLAIAAALLIVLVVRIFVCDDYSRDIRTEGAVALRETVQRTALQCYVIEGAYPPDLEYLQENYGLRINTVDYYVTYDSFASNLPPDVRVIEKAEERRCAA